MTMIYWLIPYLVTYNASEAGNWKYGPEHVFKAEVRATMTADNSAEMHSSVVMYLACQPMNSSTIQCRVESSMLKNWNFNPDGTGSSFKPYEFGNVVFQVKFNENGVSKLCLMNAMKTYRYDMLRAIFGTVHWGIDMSGKKYGRYERVEKSTIGSCETTFDIGRSASSKEETIDETSIDGYSFGVPGFEGTNEPIVIEKNRNTGRCSEKSRYLFGNSDDEVFDNEYGLKKETDVTLSRSRIYLGKNSFSAYTRNIRTLTIASSRAKTMRSFMKIDESIHFSLETIRPAKEDIGQTGDAAVGEAGSATGTH